MQNYTTHLRDVKMKIYIKQVLIIYMRNPVNSC